MDLEVLTRILRKAGELMGQTRPLLERLASSADRVHAAVRGQLWAMHEVIKPL